MLSVRFLSLTLLITLSQGPGNVGPHEIARAAPVPPERHVLLFVRGALIDYIENDVSYSYYYPQKGYFICFGTGTVGHLVFSNGIVKGPLDLLGLQYSGNTSDGRDRKSTRLNSSHIQKSRMPSSA